MLIDELLPEWEVGERHSTLVDAPQDEVYEAVCSFTARESPLFVVLMGVRALPTILTSRPDLSVNRPLIEGLVDFGFVRLAENAPHELVLGMAGRPWRLRASLEKLDAGSLRSFDEPGYVKAVMNVATFRRGRRTKLVTETRVRAFGPWARARFDAYWALIGRPSAAIRRDWLKAIKRRAENG